MKAPPAWLGNTAALVGVYFALMWGVSHWLTAWHDWDWHVFDRLKPAPIALPSSILLIDMDYDDRADIAQHRRLLSRFITAAAAQHPAAIILDIPFGQCQPACSQAMEAARTSFIQAIDQAKNNVGTDGTTHVGVFANVGEIALTPGGLPDGNAPALDPAIYSHLTGYGHTAAIIVHDSLDSGDLFYYPCYAAYPALFGRPMVSDVFALVDVALRDANGATQACNANATIAVRYGPAIPDRPPYQYHITSRVPFPRGADFAGKDVIVGVPEWDRNGRRSSRPGSELFAWIVGDEISHEQLDHAVIQPQGSMLAFIVPFFSGLVLLAYVACFLFLKRLPLGPVRPFLPWAAAILSLCIGAFAFVAFEIFSYRIQPQVALVFLGMLVAAMLCGVRGWQIERTMLSVVDDTAPPERYDYDVFLSYAHKEFDWVDEHVYRPLVRAGLTVFLDRSTIRIGTAWQDRIALSIRYSRFFIAIYSEAYFSRPYCRYEIKRAHRKWINAGEESRCVLPIMRGHVQILEAVDDIQARSIDDDPELVQHVIEDIRSRLSRATPRTQAKVSP